MTACSPAAKMEISGTLNGIESDTLLVNHRSVDGGEARLDTVPMLNGQFAFNVGDSVLKQVYIYAKPSGNGAVSMKALGLVLLPGRPVTVSGTLDDYRLSGDAFYEACNELNEQLRPFASRSSIRLVKYVCRWRLMVFLPTTSDGLMPLHENF